MTLRDTEIHDSTYDGIQFKTGGGAVTNVKIDKSGNGAGILAMSGARGSATLANVTITGSAKGDVVVEPGSQFVITGAPLPAAVTSLARREVTDRVPRRLASAPGFLRRRPAGPAGLPDGGCPSPTRRGRRVCVPRRPVA